MQAAAESETAPESQSSAMPVEPNGSVAPKADKRGKHRMLAELKRLDLETKSLEEELEELEKTGNVSGICQELLSNVENDPDPLLPLTNGPADPLWDRWFERLEDSRYCRCSIL